MWWLMFVAILCVQHTFGLRYIQITNKNSFRIWIATQTNNNGPALRNGVTLLEPGRSTKYDIPDSGWAGRLWPKTGCDGSGQKCEFGQSVPPCPSGGCQPPAETKVEFFFPNMNEKKDAFYDISLVDGFSLGSDITPYKDGKPYVQGACSKTNCQLHLNKCPRNENNGLGDLTVKKNNKAVACLSPCKRWNFPAPYGLGRNENQGDGRMLCCPSGVSVQDCRKGIVVQTQYVKLLRQACPSAYSYSYDDLGGLHNCPTATSFAVNFFS